MIISWISKIDVIFEKFLLVLFNVSLVVERIFRSNVSNQISKRLMLNKRFLHWWWILIFSHISLTFEILQVDEIRGWGLWNESGDEIYSIYSTVFKLYISVLEPSSMFFFQAFKLEEKEVFKNISPPSYKETQIWSPLNYKRRLF